ncbi:unnamed protein product, partial [Arabidopsis halleri]
MFYYAIRFYKSLLLYQRFHLVVLSAGNICVLETKKKMKLLLVRRSLHSKFQDYHILPVGEESWRTIGCKHRFLPATKTLCNRGRLYFGAKSFPSMDCILMSFDLRSEEFHRIDIPS